MGTYYTPRSRNHTNRYLVSVAEYKHYHQNGFVIMKGLLSQEDVKTLYSLAEKVRLDGKKSAQVLDSKDKSPLKEEFAQATRVHMLSRVEPEAERGMLHPRVLDVTEALIGPDVYALQSMMFLNPPGKGGQGWHQDACYIRRIRTP